MRLRYFIVFLISISISNIASSQSLVTKTGFAGFYSKTPFEDIKAENNQVYAILDSSGHHIALAMLLKGFIFPKDLMQEHFNENYVESDKYPKATFSGSCEGDQVLNKEGIYQIVIKGSLTLHGTTKPIETTGMLEVKKDKILGTTAFKLRPEDFQISIPGVVRDKIAKEIDVKVQTIWMRTN